MIRRLVLIAVLLLATGLAHSEVSKRLSQDDAARLEAFVLTENLLDFAQRSNSPQAYLMAVQLMLKYPTIHDGRDSRKAVLELIERAQDLAPDDDSIQMWAERLTKLATKTSRSEQLVSRRQDFRLSKGERYDYTVAPKPGVRTVLLASPKVNTPQFELYLWGTEGTLLGKSTEPGIKFESAEMVTVEVRHLDPRPTNYSILVN